MSVWSAIQNHIARHAMSYLLAGLLGCGASLTAVYDNFWALPPSEMAKLGWWQVLALVAKCIAPFAMAVVSYLIKSPLSEKQETAKS